MLDLEDVGDSPTVNLYGAHEGNCFNWATGLPNQTNNGNQICTTLGVFAADLSNGNVGQQVFWRLLELCPGNHQVFLDHTNQAVAQQGPDRYYMCVLMVGENQQTQNATREIHFARLCSNGFYGRPAAGVNYLTRCIYKEISDTWSSHNQFSTAMSHYFYGYYMFFVRQNNVQQNNPGGRTRKQLSDRFGKLNPAFNKGDGGGKGNGGGGQFL